MLEANFELAQKIVTCEVLPTQDNVITALDDMLNSQQQVTDKQLSNVLLLNQRTDAINELVDYCAPLTATCS